MENIVEKVKKEMKYWWISPIIGILAIIIGIWCMVTPVVTIIALSYVFGITFLITGIFEIIFAISNRKYTNNWGWTLISGIIDLIFGIMILSLPAPQMALVLSYFVGFYIMFQSIWAIGTSIELSSRKIKGWGWLLTLAILGFILSIIFIFSPIITSGFIIYLISFAFMVYGVFRIYYGFRIKGIKNDIDDFKNEIK